MRLNTGATRSRLAPRRCGRVPPPSVPSRRPGGSAGSLEGRMRQGGRIKLLCDIWLFERCSRKELAVIASHATPVQFESGKVLAREGAVGREFFVVIGGKVEATRNGLSSGVLGPGSFLGEMALLEGQPRVATVVAVEPTEVLV